jgi:hypothetical protein
MRRRYIAILAALALIATPVVISQAADTSKRKKREVDITILSARVKSLSGGKSIFAGYVTGEPFRKGAATLRISDDLSSPAKFVFYDRRGSAKAAVDLGATSQPDASGEVSVAGSGRFKGGTRRYNDSTGVLTLTGSYNDSTGTLTLRAVPEGG